jgi:hypothetical protein
MLFGYLFAHGLESYFLCFMKKFPQTILVGTIFSFLSLAKSVDCLYLHMFLCNMFLAVLSKLYGYKFYFTFNLAFKFI